MGAPDKRFDSHVDFYQAEYASFITRLTPLSFATMLAADQTAGDWSDLPTPDLVIGRVAEGRRTYSADFGAGRFGGPLARDHTFVCAPNNATSIQCTGRHSLQLVGLPYARLRHVVGDGLRLPEDGDFGALHTDMLANPMFGQMIGAMFDVADPDDPAAGLFFESTLLSLVALLVMESGKHKIKPPQRGGLAPWQVRRATEMIAQSEGPNVSLNELAAGVGMSTFHFCRAFKQSTGVAPHRYQTRLRLERAQALLADRRLSIIEVALSVGYDTPQGLARLFQRELGISPREWRRRRQR